MSWNDDQEKRRDERRQFENDVFYEAWRRGYNPDRATECATDCYYDGRTPEQCVEGYASRVRAERERRELAQAEQDHYQQLEYEHHMAEREQEQMLEEVEREMREDDSSGI